jgi:NSS family neurotransmitter:Na+ symporter
MKQNWTSHIHFILAISGAAIGLGTVWAAPFTLGSHGGGVCLFLYILLTVLIGLPILHTEILMGHRTQSNIIEGIDQLRKSADLTQRWNILGYLSACLLFFILSFYVIVGGQVIQHTLLNLFKILDINTAFDGQHQNYAYSLVFSFLTYWVSKSSLKKGIERCVKILMPALFICLIFILIGLRSLDGFDQAFNYLFRIDFNSLNMSTFSAAMGLSFFTLATGAGCMMNYGAYLSNKQSLLWVNFISSFMVILGVCLSGLIVFTMTFNQHLAPDSGPDLIFITIPLALKQFSPFDLWANVIFFLLLLSAAITSSISLLEPLMRVANEKHHIPKSKSGILSLLILCITSAIYVYVDGNLLEKVSAIIMEYLLPASALCYVLFARHTGLLKHYPENNSIINKTLLFSIHYLCPAALIFLLGSHL